MKNFGHDIAGCAGTILAGIVIILLLYGDNIVLLARCPSDLDKQLRLLKDTTTWLNHWEIDENVALQNINNIKNTVTFKFKEKNWREKDLEAKRKLRYYKEVIKPTLEDQILTSSKKKTNIAKIRTNSHELHSETSRWAVPKTPWVERICHL